MSDHLTNTRWMQLKSPPICDWELTSTASYRELIQLNDDELIFALKHHHNNNIEIMKYNIIQNEWLQMAKYPYFAGFMHDVAKTSNSSLLYIVASNFLHIVDINAKLAKQVPLDSSIISFCGGCIINAVQTVHLFETHGHPGCHLIWNANDNIPFTPYPKERVPQKKQSNKPQTTETQEKEMSALSVCAACLESKPRSAFSKSQIRKKTAVRRCMICVKNKVYVNRAKKIMKKEASPPPSPPPPPPEPVNDKQEEIKTDLVRVQRLHTIKFGRVGSGVYVASKNILILFVYVRETRKYGIWKYIIDSDEFINMMSDIPYCGPHVITEDDNYVILIFKKPEPMKGIWRHKKREKEDCGKNYDSGIYVLDIRNIDKFILKKSDVSFPVSLRTYDRFHVSKTGTNQERNIVLVTGYVKKICKIVPDEIVYSICNWLRAEMVHFILHPSEEFYREVDKNKQKEHYAVSVGDILSCVHSM